MKITKSDLTQLIKEELEAVIEQVFPGDFLVRKPKRAVPEPDAASYANLARQLATYKSKVFKMRDKQAQQIRRMIRLQKDLYDAMDILSQDRSPDMQPILDLARKIFNDLDSIHNLMLDLRNYGGPPL